jgi:bacterioferritin-associated ferredoxin
MDKGLRTVVCRCEDVTLEEIRACIKGGVTDLETLKRLLRVSMGRCQGKTCLSIVIREISLATGVPISEILPTTYRPPTVGIPLGDLAKGEVLKDED